MERKEFIKVVGIGVLGMTVAPAAYARGFKKRSDYKTCKEAWDSLCGNIGKTYKTDCFTYVHPFSKTTNVLIYGDSISIKYGYKVREELDGKANVIRLFKNGGSSHDFIPNMNKMNETMFQPHLKKGWKFNWDLIHFNVGLHDLKYLKGKHLNKAGTQVSTIDIYQKNLDGICRYLKSNYPKAKLIFATTTPVPANAKGRFKGDSIKFNMAALEVLRNHPEIVINDLYAYTFPHMEEWAQEPGNVHYNELGFTNQGIEVARVIRKYL
ncbi:MULTISPECIES: SGNH/GDSL hydrolase family protein [unclassified Saccharicrinis]|uniref:SGNH/GDSL hydrolase family protein n=1 Tax=unclassified Saccharicrinis TaxID=2646859 RepID=UPI003D3327A0